MPKFTKEELDAARLEGYTDQEIISHVAQGDNEVLNALEEGYSLNEIADYFSKNAPAKKEEAPVAEDPSLGRVATGLLAEIAVAEGAKYAGATAGAALGGAASAPTAGIASPVTVPAGAAIGYIGGALGGGWTGSLLAQEIEGATEYDYGRATIDTVLNLIPGFKIGKAGKKLAKVTGAIAKRPITTGMLVGGVATPTYMAVEEAQGKKDYTLNDYLTGAGTSAALGLGLGAAEKTISKGILKIRNKTPSEINKLIEAGDPTTIQLVDYLTAGLTPADVKMAPSKFKGSVSDFIKSSTRSTTAALAPSRVIGDEATTLAKQAKSAVEAAEGTASNIGKQIDSYLEANPQYRDDSIAFLDGEDRPNLPPELLEKLVFGRNRIRTEQQRMLDLHNSGAKLLPENKAEIIEESLNKGDYLTRAYEFFQNPNYKPSKEKYDALKASLTTGEGKMTDAQANEYLAELQLKMKSNPTDFANYMKGSGTPNVLKQRKVVSKELEDYLGLITEPGRRVGTTMSVLNRINEYNEADARIAKVLLDSGAAVRSSDPRANVQGLQPLNLKRGEFEIDGEKLLVDPSVQTALNKIYAGGVDDVSNSVVSRAIRDIYDTSVSAFKSAKVLGNLSSYLIQVPSNIAGTLGGGMNPMLGLGNAVRMSLGTLSGTKVGGLPIIKKMANEAPPLTLQKFEDLKKRGMITGNIVYEDLKAGLQGKRLGKAFQKATDTPGKIYSLPDNILRIVNYENYMDVLKKVMPTATEEQIKDMGARLTTRTYPNFESVSPEVKALSRAGVMPQFVTYSLEFARTQFEQAKLIREMMDGTFASKLGDDFKDIPVNQAALKKEAAKRLVAMGSAYAAASYGLNEFNRESLTPEQERAFRDTVAADFERDKPLFIKKNKDGSYTVVNTGYYLPQTILANPVMSVIRGENAEEGTGNLLKVFQNELVGGGSFAAQAFSSLASGRDFETGKLISNAPTAIGQAVDRSQNFAKELVPSTITALQKEDKTLQEKVARQVGLRVEKRDNAEGFGFRASGINEAIKNIKSTISGKQYALTDGKISPEEYQASIANEQNNYAANIDMMINHVKNLRTLGETDDTIIPMLKDAKFSSIDILNLLEGKNVPFDPTKKKTTVEMLDEIAGANDLETRQNIRDLVRKDPINGNKVLGAYKDRMRNVGIVQSPRESLLAGLPTDEKVKRIFPEIQASSNPDAEIRRLIKKKILTESDLEAIRIRQKLGSN
jgi:hypothetical protein